MNARPRGVMAAGMTTASIAVALLVTGCSKSTSRTVAQGPTPPPVQVSTSQPVTSPSSSAPVTLPDPCTLLTHAEAQKIAGVPLETKPDDEPAASADDIGSCTYSAPSTGSSGEVSIFVEQSQPRALGIDKALGHPFKVLPGVGDHATEEPDNSSLFIQSGSLWIYLNSAYGTTAALLQQIAPTIATRLASSSGSA